MKYLFNFSFYVSFLATLSLVTTVLFWLLDFLKMVINTGIRPQDTLKLYVNDAGRDGNFG
jgi:hypothetical protein